MKRINLSELRRRGYRRARTNSRQEDGMSFERREFLRILSYAFGSSFILKNESALAQSVGQVATPAPPAKAERSSPKPASGGTEMEKVAGIGGLFFRAHD